MARVVEATLTKPFGITFDPISGAHGCLIYEVASDGAAHRWNESAPPQHKITAGLHLTGSKALGGDTFVDMKFMEYNTIIDTLKDQGKTVCLRMSDADATAAGGSPKSRLSSKLFNKLKQKARKAKKGNVGEDVPEVGGSPRSPDSPDKHTRSAREAMLRRARGLVSKQKFRFQKDGFDLDLSYITPNIIAMGFPAEGKQGLYRNPMGEVQRFLVAYHPDKFKVYNLCSERRYSHAKFTEIGGKVAEFPFDDHNPPPFNTLLRLVHDVFEFLAEDPANCAAIHCKAGKGRTGTVIAGFLVYAQIAGCETYDQALAFYGKKRTKNSKGVTIPCQGRYVDYLDQYLREHSLSRPLPELKAPPLRLTHLIMHTLPKIADGGCTPFVQCVGAFPDSLMLYDQGEATQGKMPGFYNDHTSKIVFPLLIILQGDVKFQFRDAGKQKQLRKAPKMCHFWLNTHFCMNDNGKVRIEKQMVAKANKDKGNKKFSKSFAVELFFEVPSAEEVEELKKALSEKARLRQQALEMVKSVTKKRANKGPVQHDGEILKEDEMPDEGEVDDRFEAWMQASEFKQSAMDQMRFLAVEQKWMFLCSDAQQGGPAAFYKRGKYVRPSGHYDGDLSDHDDDWYEITADFSMEADGTFTYLTVSKGDFVEIVDQSDNDWWIAKKDNVEAYVPSNITKAAPEYMPDDDEEWVQATHDFDMVDDADFQYLSLKQGDKVQVEDSSDPVWWLGTDSTGKKAYFASNVVKPCPCPHTQSPRSRSRTTRSLASSSDPPSTLALSSQPAGEYVTCVADFAMEDDASFSYLSLSSGDSVRLVNADDPDWWLGEKDGKEAYFASSFVKRVV